MVIVVKMGDPLWKTVGRQQVELELAGEASVTDVLAHLGADYPGFESSLASGGTRLGVPYNFFVNRKLVKGEELTQRRLKSGDTLYILAPIVGG